MLIKMQKSLVNLIYGQMIFFLSLMNVTSRNCLPFQGNDCVFSCNEQKKVHLTATITIDSTSETTLGLLGLSSSVL